MQWKRIYLKCLVLGSIVITGCGQVGPALAPVTGIVTLDGKPLPEARVVFQPLGPSGSPSIAETSADGEFELSYGRNRKGAMVGEHQVRVTTEKLLTDESGKERTTPELVPPQFNQRTKLQFEVTPGKNEFEIELDSKPDTPPTPSKPKDPNAC